MTAAITHSQCTSPDGPHARTRGTMHPQPPDNCRPEVFPACMLYAPKPTQRRDGPPTLRRGGEAWPLATALPIKNEVPAVAHPTQQGRGIAVPLREGGRRHTRALHPPDARPDGAHGLPAHAQLESDATVIASSRVCGQIVVDGLSD